MDLFAVSISCELHILSESAADAEKFAEELCEYAQQEMPGEHPFRYNASKTYNQSDALKAKALNRSMVE